jgi:two-component system sporulation sensor kinase A
VCESRIHNAYVSFGSYHLTLNELVNITDTASSVGTLSIFDVAKDEVNFQVIAGSLKDAVIIVDDKGKITCWNSASEKLFGYSSAEALDRNIHQLIIPKTFCQEARDRIKTSLEIFADTGMGYFTVGNVELVGCRKDGSEIAIELTISPLKMSGKWSAIGVIKDITRRKQAEEKLREAEQRYHALFNQAPVGVLVVDPKTTDFIEFNDLAHSQLGYTREEFEKLSLVDVEVNKPRKIRKNVAELFKAGDGEFETEHQTKTGETKNVLVTTKTVKLKGTKYLQCIFRDITEIRRVQKSLSESEANYRQLVELAQEGVWVLSKDYETVFVNRRMTEMLDYSSSEMVGRSLFDFMDSREVPLAKDFLGKYTCGVSGNFEYELTRKDGSHIYASIAASQITDDKGDYLGTLALVADITLRKDMENKLEKYSKNLEEVIDQKTKELEKAQVQLIKSERLATIGELSGMIGHDLRNPLTGIKNAAYFLKRKNAGFSPQEKEMIEIIERCVEYSNKIINDLLDFSREIRLDLKEASLQKMMPESLIMANIPSTINVVSDQISTASFMADVNKLTRIFVNLIKNAVDAMPNGGTLSISSVIEDGKIKIHFSDTGMGISEDVLPKLFAPLFTTKAQGMGFGLAICKRIVEAHGGTIIVKTALEKGTTFTVTIPIEAKLQCGGDYFGPKIQNITR